MNLSDQSRNAFLPGSMSGKKGYMRWFHSFSATAVGTGQRRVFFIEYLLMNPSLGGAHPILGQLPANKRNGTRPSYVMIKAGAFADGDMPGCQLHAFYPISALKAAFQPFVLQAGKCFYSELRLRGEVTVSDKLAHRRSYMSDAGFMAWDLEVHKSISCHTGHMSSPIRSLLGTRNSYWHGEGIKTQYRGTVLFQDTVYEVTPEESYGYADKHWGRSFEDPGFTLSSCRIISEKTGRECRHSAFAVSSFSSRFPHPGNRPCLYFQLTYEGEDFDFIVRQRKHRSKWEVREGSRNTRWLIVAQNKNAVAKLSVYSPGENLMTMRYEDPQGRLPQYPLQAGGLGTGKILLYRKKPGEKELIDTLTLENVLCGC